MDRQRKYLDSLCQSLSTGVVSESQLMAFLVSFQRCGFVGVDCRQPLPQRPLDLSLPLWILLLLLHAEPDL